MNLPKDLYWTDHPAMTIAVDLGLKATKQTKHSEIIPSQVLRKNKHTKTLTTLDLQNNTHS